MKLNNRGWGIQAMMVMTLILMLCLVFVGVMIQRNFGTIIKTGLPTTKEENTTYESLEKQILSATSEYQKTNYSDIQDGERITVTLKTLQQNGLLSKVHDIHNSSLECSGYGLFYKKNNKINYEPYLKCGSYQTKGYSEVYDSK